jgi:hypothetical protein
MTVRHGDISTYWQCTPGRVSQSKESTTSSADRIACPKDRQMASFIHTIQTFVFEVNLFSLEVPISHFARINDLE